MTNRSRLEFAAVCFLAEVRRRFAARYPDEQNPILNFDNYSPKDKSDLIAALEKAILSTKEKSNVLFEQWRKRKEETNDSNGA